MALRVREFMTVVGACANEDLVGKTSPTLSFAVKRGGNLRTKDLAVTGISLLVLLTMLAAMVLSTTAPAVAQDLDCEPIFQRPGRVSLAGRGTGYRTGGQ